MQKLLWIGMAGAMGAVSRYLLSGLIQRWGGSSFPWGTAIVNVTGALLFGLIWTLAEDRLMISGETRLIVLAGFMGSYTTFSTFMFETGTLMRDSQYALALLNLLGQNAIGLAGLFTGLGLGRLIR